MVSIILQPYAQKGKSYVRDTTDFLQKIQHITLVEDDWIFALDVTSLYTNIPHHEGIKIVKDLLADRTSFPSNNNIIKMLSLVLK